MRRIVFEYSVLFTSGMVAGLFFIAVLALGGCSSPPTPTGNLTVDTANLQAFTVADAQQAEAEAVASGDIVAQPCYPAIAKLVQNLPQIGAAKGQTVGALTSFQRARNLYNPLRGGIPPELVLACGPLASQVRMDVLSLIAKVASGAAVAAVAPGLALPMLAPIP